MKRIILLVVAITMIATTASAQKVLKENVPIVRGHYSESSKEFLQNLATRIRRDGYNESADRLESIGKDGFGSGFIYTDPSTKQQYIITNRHVVAQATTANIEFGHTENKIQLDSCTILAADEEYDLALIALPEKHEFKIGSGLTIIGERKEEGTDVYSAGFPGLNGKPSWQLGKGIISNNSVKNEMFIGTSEIGAIQHSASIDPGSSGGPLVMKNDDTYQIIGVNTWGVNNRDNAYFAISGEAVKKFIDKYLNKSYDSEADLERRAKEMLQTLSKDYSKAIPYISDSYVAKMSTNNFFDIVINVPDSVDKQMATYFAIGHPIDGVRLGISYFLQKIQNKGEVKFVRIENGENPLEKTVVLLSTKEKEFNTYWIYSLGEWRLKDYAELDMKNLEDNGIVNSFNFEKGWKITYSSGKNSDNMNSTLYMAEKTNYVSNYFAMGYQIGLNKISFDNSEAIANDEMERDDVSGLLLNYFIAGQLPIKSGSFYYIPHVEIAGGITLGDMSFDSTINYSYGGGFDVAYKINSGTALSLGVGYRSLNYGGAKPFNMLNFSIGIMY